MPLTPNTPEHAPRRPQGKITEDVLQRFAQVLDKSSHVPTAAKAAGISLSTAYRLAKLSGWKPLRSEPPTARHPKTKYTQEQKNAFFTAFSRLQNASAAAREVGCPVGTAAQWMRKAGLKSPKSPAGKREAYLRLREQGFSRADAFKQVGVHERTAEEWDRGIRKSNGKRIYADGRVVDYKNGVTNYVAPNGQAQRKPVPNLTALDQPISSRYLSITEREQIYELHVAGTSIRKIAKTLERSAGTISRELRRHTVTGQSYRPYAAQRSSVRRRARPKTAKLASEGPLRDYVTEGLQLGWSPEQVCHRMVADHPDDAEMRVCHETVYQAIYVQARGGLKREVAQALRSGRARRKPHKKPDERRPRFRDPMINISERPAEVADRAVPGHWEGDLILGEGNQSAIGTLVERTTRFVMLVHLPGDHTAPTVRDGLISTMQGLPIALRGSLTWDQGAEMALHQSFAMATDMDVYFCDPHSPWQRGSNENTNGLLRQYFPKGSDLSQYDPLDLERVAALLNGRPRKTLDWKTPAERMRELLSVA